MTFCRVFLALAVFAQLSISGAQGSSAPVSRAADVKQNRALVYHGKIVRPDGSSPTGSIGVTFRILSPDPKLCLLWAETQTVDMKDGGFSVELGHGKNRIVGVNGGAAADFKQVFINNPSLTISGAQCEEGNTYTPSSADDRLLSAVFNDAGTAVVLAGLPIKSVPYALQAEEVAGFGIANLAKISGAGSNVTYSPAEVSTLKDMLGGDLFFDMKSRVVKNVAAPVDPNDAATRGWVLSEISTFGAGTVSSVSVTPPLLVSNSGTTPLISMAAASGTTNGYLSSADWTTFNSKVGSIAGSTLANGQVWVGSGANQATARTLKISDIFSVGTGAWLNVAGGCPTGQQLSHNAVTDKLECAAYALTSAQVASALGFTPANDANVVRYQGNGNVGIGTTTATVKLEVVGEIKVGNSSTACDSATEGAIRYQAAIKRMEFCNGIDWQQFSQGTSASVSIGSPSAALVGSSSFSFVITYGSATDTNTIALAPSLLQLTGTGVMSCSPTVTGTGFTRTVTVSGCTGTGSVALSVLANSALSTTGNAAAAAGPSANVTVDQTGPSAPASLSLGSVPSNLTSTPTLTYAPAVDSGGSTVASYQVQVIKDSDSSVALNWTTHLSGNNVASGLTLQHNTDYYFRVRAVDALGNVGAVAQSPVWRTVNTLFLTIAANTTDYSLHTAAVAAGWTSGRPITLTVNSGVSVGATTTGSGAIIVSSALAGAQINLVNNGSIYGMGGNGSGGGGCCAGGVTGLAGGPALWVQAAISVTNNGLIAGGGGGGGGGGGCSTASGGGGGGGAGWSGGSGGSGVSAHAGNSGAAGGGSGSTAGGGGGGGSYGCGGVGGAGGALGTAGGGGQSVSTGGGGGGAAGSSAVGSGFVTWTVVGDRRGPLN